MPSQFVGYHIDGYNRDKSIPIATGATREEAQSKAITRVLGLCITDGEIGVQEKADLSREEFAKLGEIVDAFAAKHNLPE